MKILHDVKLKHFDLLGIKEVYPVYTNAHSNGSAMIKNRPIRDFGLAMGRSFRVGWTADGRIVHSGHSVYKSNKDTMLNIQQVVIEPSFIYPHTSNTSTNTTKQVSEVDTEVDTNLSIEDQYFNDIMTCLISQSKCHTLLHPPTTTTAATSTNTSEFEGKIPLSIIPSANPDDWSEYKRFLVFLRLCKSIYNETPDYYDITNISTSTSNESNNKTRKQTEESIIWLGNKILELMQASIGQERWSDTNLVENEAYFMPFLEQKKNIPIHLWERRREAISQWLQSICEEQGM